MESKPEPRTLGSPCQNHSGHPADNPTLSGWAFILIWILIIAFCLAAWAWLVFRAADLVTYLKGWLF